MLLTGDARGDDMIAGLEAAQLLQHGQEPLKVDLLKMPHHGSSRNIDEEFFRQIPADHYVISADGRDGNPDPATLGMLARARGDEEYTLHFTVRKNFDEEEDALRRAHLSELRDWLRDERPPNCHASFRGADATASSIQVDLGDALT